MAKQKKPKETTNKGTPPILPPVHDVPGNQPPPIPDVVIDVGKGVVYVKPPEDEELVRDGIRYRAVEWKIVKMLRNGDWISELNLRECLPLVDINDRESNALTQHVYNVRNKIRLRGFGIHTRFDQVTNRTYYRMFRYVGRSDQ